MLRHQVSYSFHILQRSQLLSVEASLVLGQANVVDPVSSAGKHKLTLLHTQVFKMNSSFFVAELGRKSPQVLMGTHDLEELFVVTFGTVVGPHAVVVCDGPLLWPGDVSKDPAVLEIIKQSGKIRTVLDDVRRSEGGKGLVVVPNFSESERNELRGEERESKQTLHSVLHFDVGVLVEAAKAEGGHVLVDSRSEVKKATSLADVGKNRRHGIHYSPFKITSVQHPNHWMVSQNR